MLELILSLILIGVLLYLIELLPMDATVKQLIRVVVIVAVILWLIAALFGGVATLPFGRLHPYYPRGP